MTAAFDTPAAQIPRDRWKRPMVTPVDGGKPVPYTRCTTFVDCLDDKYNLQQWQLRQAAIGLSERPDLLLSVSAHRDDKHAVNGIVDKAMEAARSSAASTTGTALHALCERVDRGHSLGIVPPSARDDIAAYQAATRTLEHVYIEQFSVHDGLKIGGTPDRVVWWGQKHYIADLKTGKDIEWGALTIAMQLAVYAHSTPYLPPGVRAPYPFDVDQDQAIVIHLPAGQRVCTLHFVDIAKGWEAVQVAGQVRKLRSHKHWYTAIPQLDPPPAMAMLTVDDQIERASTLEELRMVWTNAIAAQIWTDAHLRKALERKETLERIAS